VRNRLKVLRAEHNLSQAELGDLVGLSRQAINAIELDRYDPSLPVAIRIARHFGVQVEDIFLLDDPGKKELPR
jgi:putative transcriptional regulator